MKKILTAMALLLAISGLRGAADFVPADRFPKTMDTLCKEISKLK